MKYLLSSIIIISFSILINGYSIAGNNKEHNHLTPYTGTPEFEKVKSLVGTWKGKTKMGEKVKDITVTYTISSAGSVVIEKMFPGTPEEMVSIYYDEDEKLSMTHFCALKNQPHMTLKKSEDRRIDLSFSSGSNFDHWKDPHMHSMSIDFVDRDNIVHTWTMYADGKEKETSRFELSRSIN